MRFLITPKGFVCLAAGFVGMLAFPPFAAYTRAGTPPPTDQFQDQSPLGWSGGDLVAPDGAVPVDTSETYEGLPSLRYEIRDEPRQ